MKKDVMEMVKRLATLPCTSNSYEMLLKEIQKEERDCYGNQHILCIDSFRARKQFDARTKILTPAAYENQCEHLQFNDFSDFNTISGYFPRYLVEHDYRYKQILTFGYITDNFNNIFILIRKNKDNRLGMVGGHTDFDESAYGTKPHEFLINNLVKELFEEVKIIEKDTNEPIEDIVSLNATITPKIFVNENSDFYTLKNAAFIYEIKLDTKFMLEEYELHSNEPDNHLMTSLTYEDIECSLNSHSMVEYMLKSLNEDIRKVFK